MNLKFEFSRQIKQLKLCKQRKPLKSQFHYQSVKMGNVQGQHGDHARKHSGAGHGVSEGLVFGGDKNQREMSPFDPVSNRYIFY